MKQAKVIMQFVCAAALAAFLPACTTTGGMASASPQTETMLTQAGFTTHVATTAKQKAHIQSMPNGKLQTLKAGDDYKAVITPGPAPPAPPVLRDGPSHWLTWAV